MVLTYHEIVPEASLYVYSVSVAQLERHLAELSTLDAAPEITFDDGHASYLQHAIPLLDRFGMSSTVFVTAGWTGVRTGYMDWSELQEVVRKGHKVQAHGWSHQWLTRCAGADLDYELRGARDVLQNRLGVPIDAVSIPHGRYDARVLTAAASAGYHRVYTSEPFTPLAHRGNVAVIGRMMLRRNMAASDLRRWLAAEHAPFSRLQIEYWLKRHVRTLMGGSLYHRIWLMAGADSDREDINHSYGRSSRADERAGWI